MSGYVRHRADVVEYRVEQHANILRARLDELALRFGTDADTAGVASFVSDVGPLAQVVRAADS